MCLSYSRAILLLQEPAIPLKYFVHLNLPLLHFSSKIGEASMTGAGGKGRAVNLLKNLIGEQILEDMVQFYTS